MLHLTGKSYGKRPSDLLGLTTEWGAWQLDELCATVGALVEGNLMQGKPAFDGFVSAEAPAGNGTRRFRSAKHLVKRKVKIKPDGTW